MEIPRGSLRALGKRSLRAGFTAHGAAGRRRSRVTWTYPQSLIRRAQSLQALLEVSEGRGWLKWKWIKQRPQGME